MSDSSKPDSQQDLNISSPSNQTVYNTEIDAEEPVLDPSLVGTSGWSSELIARPGKMFEWARRSCGRTRQPVLPGAQLEAPPGPLPRPDTLFSPDVAAASPDPSAGSGAGSGATTSEPREPTVEKSAHPPLSTQTRAKKTSAASPENAAPIPDPRARSASPGAVGASAPSTSGAGSPAANPSSTGSATGSSNTSGKKPANIDSLLTRTLASDQQASLTLQQMLKTAGPQQLATLQHEIMGRLDLMVVSRFGNFVVQRMLEVSDRTFVEQVAFAALRGQVAQLSLNSFACYVLQKLLDLGSQELRQQILDEMLASIVQTITNAFGTHVWQKLLHLPWPETSPSVVKQVTAALDAAYASEIAQDGGGECSGWMYILAFSPGAAAARSLIGASHLPGAAQVLNRLSQSLDDLITTPNLQSIVLRMAQGANVYRDRVLDHVLAHADTYAHSSQVVPFLQDLLALNIPSFKQKLRARLSSVPPELASALAD